ncbi:DUF1707 SHOCT-like domain-containing protein [Halostreptopolyspora alba]|uniref:DUF1707 and DUF2154 domain-containing protein n=1 Tax=Halostreptopolyspora alba TaxID=2487137 RepID=A0A3N0E9M7_9ACTN|nr:DUF1707 and DUF2154 domain-containing protein [Nocardiopsaceae bacterium YIM 96095]
MADTPNSPSPDGRDRMRASDTDRDTVAARLREALADGRLTPEEHSNRLDAIYNSTTLGELEPLTADLPAGTGPERATPPMTASPRPVYGAERVEETRASGYVSLAFMGAAERSGNWTVPARYLATAGMGGVSLDLREARFTQREVTIVATAVMGGIEIIVPDDIEVRVHGLGVMGGFGSGGEVDAPSVTDPGTPIVNVTGLAVMGGVAVERRRRKHQKQPETDPDE